MMPMEMLSDISEDEEKCEKPEEYLVKVKKTKKKRKMKLFF